MFEDFNEPNWGGPKRVSPPQPRAGRITGGGMSPPSAHGTGVRLPGTPANGSLPRYATGDGGRSEGLLPRGGAVSAGRAWNSGAPARGTSRPHNGALLHMVDDRFEADLRPFRRLPEALRQQDLLPGRARVDDDPGRHFFAEFTEPLGIGEPQ